MSVTHYQFDGENLTAGQIHRRYPAYSVDSIRRYMRMDEPPRDLAGLIRCAAQAKGRCVAAAKRNGFNNRVHSLKPLNGSPMRLAPRPATLSFQEWCKAFDVPFYTLRALIRHPEAPKPLRCDCRNPGNGKNTTRRYYSLPEIAAFMEKHAPSYGVMR